MNGWGTISKDSLFLRGKTVKGQRVSHSRAALRKTSYCYLVGCVAVTIGAFDHPDPQALLPTINTGSEIMLLKLVRSKRGVDTILASLLMVVIVVAASVMVFVYATGLFGALTQAPNLQREGLSLEFSNFGPQNPTYNLTLYVRNTGSTPISLVAYIVKNGNSSQYAKTTWTGPPSINPTSLGQAQILISNACGCTNTGGTFSFAVGNSYTVTMLSLRGTQFSFSVVRYS